jgi:hypothetical protein
MQNSYQKALFWLKIAEKLKIIILFFIILNFIPIFYILIKKIILNFQLYYIYIKFIDIVKSNLLYKSTIK